MPSSTARCLTECTAQCAAAQCTVAGPVQGRAGCKHPASDGHSTLQSTDNTLMSSINFVNPYTQHCRCHNITTHTKLNDDNKEDSYREEIPCACLLPHDSGSWEWQHCIVTIVPAVDGIITTASCSLHIVTPGAWLAFTTFMSEDKCKSKMNKMVQHNYDWWHSSVC